MLALICCWMTWTWLHKNEVRAELRTYRIYRHPACRGVSSFSWRRLDESRTLLSIGRIDKVYHKVPDSSREKQVESLRKTENTVILPAVAYPALAGEDWTNLARCSPPNTVILTNLVFWFIDRHPACQAEAVRRLDVPFTLLSTKHTSSWRILYVVLHRKDRQSISSISSSWRTFHVALLRKDR